MISINTLFRILRLIKKEYAPDIDTVLHTDLGVYTEYGPKFPEWFKLHDYQDEAITEWQKRNYRGIFDMATGTGKTYTGLGALTTLSKNLAISWQQLSSVLISTLLSSG